MPLMIPAITVRSPALPALSTFNYSDPPIGEAVKKLAASDYRG